MALVSELDLPAFDYTAPDFSTDRYHQLLPETCRHGWLARSPLAYTVLVRDRGKLFLRSKATAFPGRQIAEFFGVTAGPLADHIDANILNLSGERHRRLRGLVGQAFSPRAAARWRPAMRGFLRQLWARVADGGGCDFVATVARPYPALTIATVLGAPQSDAGLRQNSSTRAHSQGDLQAGEARREDINQPPAQVQQHVAQLLEARR